MCLCIAAANFFEYRLYHFRVGSSIVQPVTIGQSLQRKIKRIPNYNQFYDLLKLSTNMNIATLLRKQKKTRIILNESNFMSTENLWPCHFCEPFFREYSMSFIHALIQYDWPKKKLSNKILRLTMQKQFEGFAAFIFSVNLWRAFINRTAQSSSQLWTVDPFCFFFNERLSIEFLSLFVASHSV